MALCLQQRILGSLRFAIWGLLGAFLLVPFQSLPWGLAWTVFEVPWSKWREQKIRDPLMSGIFSLTIGEKMVFVMFALQEMTMKRIRYLGLIRRESKLGKVPVRPGHLALTYLA